MTNALKGSTPNYDFNLINFDYPRWHTYDWNNWQKLDVILKAQGTINVGGVWKVNTLYKAGERLADGVFGEVYRANTTHTSPPSGTFAAYRAANPLVWTVVPTTPYYTGQWTSSTVYNAADIVIYDNAWYYCTVAHIAGTFLTDLANAKWTLIFNAGRTKIVSVLDYGAIGNNSYDCTTAFNAAIAYASILPSGAVVAVPAGRYVISSALVVPATKSILFRGDGIGISVIRQTNASADGIVFNNNEYLASMGGVQSLSVEAGVGFRAGSFFGQGSTGTGVKVIHGNRGFSLRSLDVSNFANGVALLSTWDAVYHDIHIKFFSGNGLTIDASADGTVAGGNKIFGGTISNNGFEGDKSASVGIRIRASGGEFINTIDVTSTFNGIKVDPPAGRQVAYLWFKQVLADTCVGDGWVFDGTAGAIIRTDIAASWGAYGAANGLVTKGANLKGLRAVNMGLRENVLRGWDHQGGIGIEFIDADINSNSRGNPNVHPGVLIASGASRFAILGGTIGNNESSVSDQAEGIKFVGSASSFRIANVDMTSPGAGKNCIVYDELSVANAVISNNIPPGYGMNLSSRTSVTGGDFVNGNTTAYIGCRSAQSFANLTPWRQNRNAIITRFRAFVGSAPGNGESFSYRLVKNGTPIGATAVISGASTYSVAGYGSGGTFVDGDSYEVQVIGSAGSAGSVHTVWIEMEPQ